MQSQLIEQYNDEDVHRESYDGDLLADACDGWMGIFFLFLFLSIEMEIIKKKVSSSNVVTAMFLRFVCWDLKLCLDARKYPSR